MQTNHKHLRKKAGGLCWDPWGKSDIGSNTNPCNMNSGKYICDNKSGHVQSMRPECVCLIQLSYCVFGFMTAEYLREMYEYIKYTGECCCLIEYAAIWHTHTETHGFASAAYRCSEWDCSAVHSLRQGHKENVCVHVCDFRSHHVKII